jgi:signal transduction histidine kinase
VRRRFTIAIVGVVAAALLVTGIGTLVLLQAQSRRNTRRDLVQLASNVATTASLTRNNANFTRLKAFLGRTQDMAIVRVPVPAQARLPKGMTLSSLDVAQLSAGQTVSGLNGSVAFSAVPFRTVNGLLFAVAVSQPASRGGGAGLYFLLSAGVALLVAAAVAETMARRITHPLVTAQQATRHIADGDLSVRVPMPTGSYPELAGLAESINTMAATLEHLRGGERQFLLSVSHDLRTPLTSIRGFAEAMADGTATDTTRAADVIASEARRLERLVDDLLDLAKLQTQRFSLDVRPTDLAEVVTDTAEGFAPAAESLGLHLIVAEPITVARNGSDGSAWPTPLPSDRWPAVSADPDRLAQVVANLVENAMRFANTGVKVGMWFQGAPGGRSTAQITVDDDGPGIAAADLPRVFERLWTTSATERAPGRQVGSGLGLAIVSELVAAMGGTVTAQSPAPLANTAQPLGSTPTGSNAGPSGSTPTWSTPTGPDTEPLGTTPTGFVGGMSAAPERSFPGTRITVSLRMWPTGPTSSGFPA